MGILIRISMVCIFENHWSEPHPAGPPIPCGNTRPPTTCHPETSVWNHLHPSGSPGGPNPPAKHRPTKQGASPALRWGTKLTITWPTTKPAGSACTPPGNPSSWNPIRAGSRPPDAWSKTIAATKCSQSPMDHGVWTMMRPLRPPASGFSRLPDSINSKSKSQATAA